MSALMLPALPFPLDPLHVPFEVVGEDGLRATSQARTDIFAPPFPRRGAHAHCGDVVRHRARG